MKVRKKQIKVRRKLPSPPWQFRISSVESQSIPLPLLPYLLSFQNAPALKTESSQQVEKKRRMPALFQWQLLVLSERVYC